jgi:glycosyltransferase involved in cell wall biosynthesis
MKTAFDLSLLICTRNRATQLAQTLQRVAKIRTQLNWELIIVDNASTDRTVAVAKEFAATYHRSVQTIVQEGRGVACAKNAGWRAAKSKVVCCIDDDCYPEENFLDEMSDSFNQDPQLGFVGGRILLFDPTDRRITIQESLEPLSFPGGSFIRPGVIQGANIAYRRAALEDVNGFDEWFGAGAIYSGDETELMARLSAAGWKGAYNPKPVVYHHHGRKSASDEWRLMRWYDRGRGAYYAKFMLNKVTRNVYLKNWFLTRRNHSWKTTALEIAAGLDYFARAWRARRPLSS